MSSDSTSASEPERELSLETRKAAEALARPRWEREDYDIDDMEDWEPLRGTGYDTGKVVSEEYMSAMACGPVFHVEYDIGLEEADHTVSYGENGVTLMSSVSGEDDRQVYVTSRLTPATAIELASMLCQGAIEQSRRKTHERSE